MKVQTWGRLLGLGMAALAALPPGAQAQTWPTKQPIKLIAVFPPGGSVDQVARLLAQPLSLQLGQSVIVENKGGASGSIGAAAVAAAPADGYTFAVVFDTHGVNPSLIPGLSFDSKKDLTPVVLIGTAPMVLATQVGSEFKTLADAVAAAKTKSGVSYGSRAGGAGAGLPAGSTRRRHGHARGRRRQRRSRGRCQQDQRSSHRRPHGERRRHSRRSG